MSNQVKTAEISQEYYDELVKELDYLKTVKSVKNVEDIKTARDFGDLSENAEYHAALDEQANIAQRIAELEEIIKNAIIVDLSKLDKNTVQVLNSVKVKNLNDGKIYDVNIVGAQEVDIFKWKISKDSPIGKALMGHSAGDVVEVEAPAGTFKYEIIEIFTPEEKANQE